MLARSDVIADGFIGGDDCVEVNSNPCDMFLRGLTSTSVKFAMDNGGRVKNAGRLSVTSRKCTISKSGCENTGLVKSPAGIVPAPQKHMLG